MSEPNDPDSAGWAAPGAAGTPSPPPSVVPPPPGEPYPPASGYVQQGYGYGVGTVPQKTSGLAIAALVCGIVGIFFAAIPLGTLAFIFGLVSLSKINQSQGVVKGRGMAIAGIVLGPIDIAVGIVILSSVF